MRLVIWLVQCAWGCHHSRLSNVFTIKKRTYQVCLECGREFPYSWELMRSVPIKYCEYLCAALQRWPTRDLGNLNWTHAPVLKFLV